MNFKNPGKKSASVGLGTTTDDNQKIGHNRTHKSTTLGIHKPDAVKSCFRMLWAQVND